MTTIDSPAGYARRKDPIRIRAALIDAATAVIAEQGMTRLTVEAVAKAAGVTKGGLFHHFASKHELIQGVMADMLASAERTVAAAMAEDPEPWGRFTRGYLAGVFARQQDSAAAAASRSLCLGILGDPALQDHWGAWVAAQVERHAATDDNPRCALVRLAADGIWLRSLRCPDRQPLVSSEVRAALLGLTRPAPALTAAP